MFARFTVLLYTSVGVLLIFFVLSLVLLVTTLLDSETGSSNLSLSSSKLFLQLYWCIFNPLVDFTIFLHKLHCIVPLSIGDSNDIFF